MFYLRLQTSFFRLPRHVRDSIWDYIHKQHNKNVYCDSMMNQNCYAVNLINILIDL